MNKQLTEDSEYAIWRERHVIVDCLRDLELPVPSKEIMKSTAPHELVDYVLRIIQREAKLLKRHDVLERLSFAGLVYG